MWFLANIICYNFIMEGGEIMAYKESIAVEIRELFKNAPEGHSEYTLPQFDQQDVADTVNFFANTNPKGIQQTEVNYSNKAPIVFMK